jgi:hypothetical protein
MFIGYEGYSPSNSGIADRRRVLFWAKSRGHTIVGSRDSRADVIVITSSSDLGYWAKHTSQKPLILDVVDGLIGEQSNTKNLLRGYGYWVTRKSTNTLPLTYRQLILSVAKKCAVVVCSSPEQVAEWAKFKIKARDILDIHEEVPSKSNSIGSKAIDSKDIFWEGLPATLNSMSLLNEFFISNNDINFRLNVLTNLKSYKYMNKFKKVNVSELVTRQLKHSNLSINLSQWSPSELVTNSGKSFVGVLPILGFQGYNHLKAENRLLIMWRLGLPVLASPLLSYVRVMKSAGLEGICKDQYEWSTKTKLLYDSADMRTEFYEKGRLYLEKHHNLDDLLIKWDEAVANQIL